MEQHTFFRSVFSGVKSRWNCVSKMLSLHLVMFNCCIRRMLSSAFIHILLYMYSCTCIYMHTHTHTHACTHARTHTRTHTHTHTHAHTHTHTHTHTYTHTHTHTYMHMQAEQDPPNHITVLFRRGSRFHYSGQTYRQTLGSKGRKQHDFQRYCGLVMLPK